MLNILLKSFVMLAVLFGLADVSLGESTDSSKLFSIGPRATFSQPKDADSGSWSGGAQVRLGLIPSLRLEGSVDYRSNDFGLTKVSVCPVQASLLVYLNTKTICPLLLGGVGWYYTKIEGPFDLSVTTNRFGVHAGAGLEIKLNDTLSLDGIYRRIWMEKFTSKDAAAIDKQYDDSGYMVTMGLNLWL